MAARSAAKTPALTAAVYPQSLPCQRVRKVAVPQVVKTAPPVHIPHCALGSALLTELEYLALMLPAAAVA